MNDEPDDIRKIADGLSDGWNPEKKWAEFSGLVGEMAGFGSLKKIQAERFERLQQIWTEEAHSFLREHRYADLRALVKDMRNTLEGAKAALRESNDMTMASDSADSILNDWLSIGDGSGLEDAEITEHERLPDSIEVEFIDGVTTVSIHTDWADDEDESLVITLTMQKTCSWSELLEAINENIDEFSNRTRSITLDIALTLHRHDVLYMVMYEYQIAGFIDQLDETEEDAALAEIRSLRNELQARDHHQAALQAKVVTLRRDKSQLSVMAKRPDRERLIDLMDEHRFSNGSVNFASLGRAMGRSDKTARRWVEQAGLTSNATNQT